MLLSVPPKYSVSNVMGFIRGKSAIHIARVYAGRRRNFVGQHFWADVCGGVTNGKHPDTRTQAKRLNSRRLSCRAARD
jgi:REP element-mobilizing transposase RayT